MRITTLMRVGISAALMAALGLTLRVPKAAAFSVSNVVGPYGFNARGYFVDNDGATGRLTINGVLVFNGAGSVATTSTGLAVTGATSGLTGSNSTSGQGGDQFTCIAVINGGSYTVTPDGILTFTLLFSTSGQCLGNPNSGSSGTSAITFYGPFIPGDVGATSRLDSTYFTQPNLTSTPPQGITFPEMGQNPDSSGATEIITGLTLSATLVRQ